MFPVRVSLPGGMRTMNRIHYLCFDLLGKETGNHKTETKSWPFGFFWPYSYRELKAALIGHYLLLALFE